MSFREAVIVPLSMWEKCNFRAQETITQQQQQTGFIYNKRLAKESDHILFDTSMPPDLKMKLYNQQTKLSPPQTKYQKVEVYKPPVDTAHQETADIDTILQDISSKNIPYARSILSKILANKETIRWNDKLEVVIDKKTYQDSNIIELMRYVLGEKIITFDVDIPIAGEHFYHNLKIIGVPISSVGWKKVPTELLHNKWAVCGRRC